MEQETMRIHNFGMMIPKQPHYPTKSFSINFICGAYSKGWFWFRIFMFGLYFKNSKTEPALFSERNGYKKYLQIGKWRIFLLLPSLPQFLKKRKIITYQYKSFEVDKYSTDMFEKKKQ